MQATPEDPMLFVVRYGRPEPDWLESIHHDRPPVSQHSRKRRDRREHLRLRRLSQQLKTEGYILDTVCCILRTGAFMEGGFAATFDRTCGITLVVAQSLGSPEEPRRLIGGLLEILASPTATYGDALFFLVTHRRERLQTLLVNINRYLKNLTDDRDLSQLYEPSTFEDEFPAHWRKALAEHPAAEWGVSVLLQAIIADIATNIVYFTRTPEDRPDIAITLFVHIVSYARAFHDSRCFTRLSLHPELECWTKEFSAHMKMLHHYTEGLSFVWAQYRRYFRGQPIPYRWATNRDLVEPRGRTRLSNSIFDVRDADGEPWMDVPSDSFIGDYLIEIGNWRDTTITHIHAEQRLLMDAGILQEQTQPWANKLKKGVRCNYEACHRVMGLSAPICAYCDAWMEEYSSMMGTRWHGAKRDDSVIYSWAIPHYAEPPRPKLGEWDPPVLEDDAKRDIREKLEELGRRSREDARARVAARLEELGRTPKPSWAKSRRRKGPTLDVGSDRAWNLLMRNPAVLRLMGEDNEEGWISKKSRIAQWGASRSPYPLPRSIRVA